MSEFRCGDCFKWNTKDCAKLDVRYPNMPIWDKSIPCDRFVPVDPSKQNSTKSILCEGEKE